MFMRGAPCGTAWIAWSTDACGGNSTFGGAGAAGGAAAGASAGGVAGAGAAAGVGGGLSFAGSFGEGGVSGGGDELLDPPQEKRKSPMDTRISAFMSPRLPVSSVVGQGQGLALTTDSHFVGLSASVGCRT